jgi:hypothetical protein
MNIIQTEVQHSAEKRVLLFRDHYGVCIVSAKTLTAVRVASKMKKIDIDIQKLRPVCTQSIHFTARKLYSNVYLFEKDLISAQLTTGLLPIVQKHSH